MMKIIKNFNVNEYTSWILSRFSPHNAVLLAETATDIDESKLKKTVEFVFLTEGNLKLTISPKTCGFIECKNDASIYCNEIHDSWQSAIENELNTSFAEGDLLVRIKIIKANELKYILICFHHIICDGKSMINFFNKIIMTYNYGFCCPHVKSIHAHTNNFLPLPDLREASPSNYLIKNSTKISGITIDQNHIQKIVLYSKKINKSVNSLLSSIILLSFYDCFNINDNVTFHVPIDLRNQDKIYDQPILDFFTSWINIGIDFKAYTDSIFLINFIESRLKKSLSEGEHLNNLNALNLYINNRSDDNQFVKNFVSTSPTICVSNCGVVKLPLVPKKSTQMITISEIHMIVNCQSYMGTEHSLVTVITSLHNGKTAIDVCYPFPLVSEESIVRFIGILNEKILDFIKEIQ